jgi:hypothetical protein
LTNNDHVFSYNLRSCKEERETAKRSYRRKEWVRIEGLQGWD